MNLRKLFPIVALIAATVAGSLAHAQLTPILKTWPGTLKTTESTGPGPSANLWGHWLNRTRGAQDFTEDGVQFFENFCNFGVGSGTVYKGYGIHLDSGTTIQEIATEIGGVVRFSTDTTDNNSCELCTGGNQGTLVKIPAGTGGDMVIFEERFRVSQITNTYDWFGGLTDKGCAVDNGVFTDADASADKNLIGFRVVATAGNALEFVYKASGQTLQTTTGLKTLVANTWYRCGFVYNPRQAANKRLMVYIDNADTGTAFTQTNLAAATFPSATPLAVTMGLKNNGTSAMTVDADWVGVAEAQ